MTGIVKTICAIILFSIASVVAWYAVPLPLYEIYYGSYEHDPWHWEDCRRLPLWYPYEIVEEHDSFTDSNTPKHVRLINREAYQDSLVDGRLCNVEDTLEEEMLLRTNDILSFNSSSNVVWGKRALVHRKQVEDGRIQKRYMGERYFIFATNTDGILYFKDADAYEDQCRRYHLSPSDLKSFDEKYSEFMQRNDAMFCDILRFSFKRLSASGVIWVLAGLGFWCWACYSVIRTVLCCTHIVENVNKKEPICR